jgi:hypothetical protein
LTVAFGSVAVGLPSGIALGLALSVGRGRRDEG